VYASSSSALATGSALTFDGTNLGVGTASPDSFVTINKNAITPSVNLSTGTNLHLLGLDGANSRIQIDSFGSTGTSGITFQRALGTAASKSAIVANSTLGFINVNGYGATGYLGNLATISIQSDEAFTDTSTGTRIIFGTSTNGSAGQSEKMRLDNAGNLGIGTSSPTAKLTINSFVNISGPIASFKQSAETSAFNGLALQRSANDTTLGLAFNSSADAWQLSSSYSSTGAYKPIQLVTSDVVRVTLDTAGNLGLGVTPSAWSVLTALQVKNASVWGSGADSGFANNGFFNGSGWRYITTSGAALYQTSANVHAWYNAPSGTAGNAISFTQAMTLDASGNLGIGTSSPASTLDVVATGVAVGTIRTSSTTGARDAKLRLNVPSTGGDDPAGQIEFTYGTGYTVAGSIQMTHTNPNMKFFTGTTERARIDGNGNLLVGGTSVVLSSKFLSQFNGNTNNGAVLNETANATSTTFLAFTLSGTDIGSVIRVGATSAVVYNTTSDYRLKTVTGAVTGQGARIDALKPVDYLWKEDNSQARGFLAHEFQTVYPNSVSGDKDAVDANGNPKHQSMQAATSEVIADLVAEIQSLRQRLSAANL
jgi:hypothetical protein